MLWMNYCKIVEQMTKYIKFKKGPYDTDPFLSIGKRKLHSYYLNSLLE